MPSDPRPEPSPADAAAREQRLLELATYLGDGRLRAALVRCGDRSPDDTIQDALLALSRQLSAGKLPAEVYYGYVLRRARWEDSTRRKKRSASEVQLPDAAGDPEGSGPLEPSSIPLFGCLLDQREMAAEVTRALAEEQELNRSIFLMRVLDGLTYAEIAVRKGMSYDAVKDRFEALVKRVRTRLPKVEQAFREGAGTAHYGNGCPSAVWIDAAGAELPLQISAGELLLTEGSLSGHVRLYADPALRARLAPGFACGFARDPESGLLLPLAPFVPSFERESARDAELELLLPLGLEGRARVLPAENLHLAFFEPAAA
jgi:DNA-directed RNA polymerase specialized sigma24 family protein